jgi:TDG/mug DNA glycosylase family protein
MRYGGIVHVHSFPAIADGNASILILGTMPGKASLRAGQYYAHERNAFWGIIAALFGVPATAPYVERGARLRAQGIALWDVLQSCRRESSLDSDIVPESIVPNRIADFLREHPRVRWIYFNGASAETLYMRHVRPLLDDGRSGLSYTRLPSTSPANARLTAAAKLERWSVIRHAT